MPIIIKKPTAKPKFNEHLVGRIACYHFICKMDYEALKWAFEVSISDLELMQTDPAWVNQIQYLRELEHVPVTNGDGLTTPLLNSTL